MGKVIGVANQKGGVGTTTCVNLGIGLAIGLWEFRFAKPSHSRFLQYKRDSQFAFNPFHTFYTSLHNEFNLANDQK